MNEQQMAQYLKDKEERFCSGYAGELPHNQGWIACGRFLGYEETGTETFLVRTKTEQGNVVRLGLCPECQAYYREQGWLVETEEA